MKRKPHPPVSLSTSVLPVNPELRRLVVDVLRYNLRNSTWTLAIRHCWLRLAGKWP